MAKRSRYDNARSFKAQQGASGTFSGIRPRDIGSAAGVLEHTIKEWERADLLALNYYNDGDLWWRILDANPGVMCAIDLFGPPADQVTPAGTVILVPKARE